MAVLDRKMFRDFLRLWAQGLAISLVMACGVATILISVGTYRSLDETRSAFYERYRFGSIFASVVRAPQHIKSKIEAISDVSSVETRIVKPVLLDIVGMAEPASGIVVSVPDFRETGVNRLYMRRGRMPEPGRTNEVAVVETFAKAHELAPGDQFSVILGGKKRELKIVGIVLSPEYIYSLGPGDLVPDERRFGIFYMSLKVLEGLFDMERAFNNVSLTVLWGTNEQRLIEELDRILKPYGGTGAYGREDQMSHAFLDAELKQLRGMSTVIPPIFLFVSAFLVNMILSRLIALEREQIGLFKALGYSNFAVGWHYAKLVIVIALVGLVIGSAAGFWLGRGLTDLYASFFSFPFLIFKQNLDLYFLAGGVSILAALAGAAKSIITIAGLAPAVAMRPPAPTVYGDSYLKFRDTRVFSQLTTMALRHLIRWPVRSSLTTLGTSLSVALLVTAMFSYDSIDFMIDTIFFRADRQDATTSFESDRGFDALPAVVKLPGVLRAEPFRATPVKLRSGHRELRMTVVGTSADGQLSRVLDLDLNPLPLPSSGLVISERVAEKLKLAPGTQVEIELLEKNSRVVFVPIASVASGSQLETDTENIQRQSSTTPVVAIAQSYVGLTAHMTLSALNRIMQDGRQVSGARLLIDGNRLNDLYREVKRTPSLASIALQKLSYRKFRDTIEENVVIMNRVYITLAVVMAFGVIYNSARIQLSERARELASLRVFGFTKAEVSKVLMLELSIMILLAQPVGWLLGYGFSWSVLKGFQTDLFRVPLIVHPSTYSTASLIIVIAALFSALIVRRRVNRLDLIRVLKTRE